MFKDLALVVDGRTKEASRHALSLAQRLDAHLTAISADIESAVAVYSTAELRYDLILAATQGRREAASKAVENLKAQALAEGLVVDALSLENMDGGGIDDLTRALRLFDLIILEQTDSKSSKGRSRTIEAVVFETSKPVLIIPYVPTRAPALKTALVAWDDSAPAARALGDALPLLSQADRVEILSVNGKGLSGNGVHGTAVTRHLARHGINAVFKRTPSAGDVGNTLLSHAADVSADFLVMGAYGHSRLREAIFGGTTRTLLESMTIPVLMSR